MFEAFLDSVLGFLLDWPPLISVLVVSLAISVLSLLITKFTTNQVEMKRLKDELDANQKKMKSLRDKPDEMMKIQKETMALHGQYFRHSMIPTFIMLIPLGLLFGWMGGHFGHQPLAPNEEFVILAIAQEGISGNVSLHAEGLEPSSSTAELVNEQVNFSLKGPIGEYSAKFESNAQVVEKDLIISDQQRYAPVLEQYKNPVFKEVRIENKELDLVWKFGWLGTYIISAIVFISVLRKLLKVY